MEEKILQKLGLEPAGWGVAPYGKRAGITNVTLISAYLKCLTTKKVSEYLNISYTSLERYMQRHWTPRFTEKFPKEHWSSFFLRCVDIKVCSGCYKEKTLSNFYPKGNTYHSLCKLCDSYRSKVYYDADKQAQRSAEHYINNKEAYIARNAKRRAAEMQAVPSWANIGDIEQMYVSCPEGYEVDHIIPLQHPLVCGLHVINNLQHLSMSDNRSKSNKFTIQ